MEWTKEQEQAAREEYDKAVLGNENKWVVACGGQEVPTKAKNGRVYLYVFNPATQGHGWLDMGTDIVQLDDPYCCDMCQWVSEMEGGQ
ncbi:MAG: hypothetical protein ACXAEN_22385 [Candidatus Thorarchaeota archaeon]|jgi:hypothetical protein